MRIGKHKEAEQSWKVSEMEITETSKYKYLGDMITNDGKNKENIIMRKGRLNGTIININTIAESEMLNRIETSVLIELHEKMNIPSLLNNSESWSLTKSEEENLETIEIQTLKELFDLPLHTPNVAIIHTFGTLYTKQQVDKKLLIYLHKILNKTEENWVKKTLQLLESMNIGWYKKIMIL